MSTQATGFAGLTFRVLHLFLASKAYVYVQCSLDCALMICVLLLAMAPVLQFQNLRCFFLFWGIDTAIFSGTWSWIWASSGRLDFTGLAPPNNESLDLRTDRQTDRQTDHRGKISVGSVIYRLIVQQRCQINTLSILSKDVIRTPPC